MALNHSLPYRYGPPAAAPAVIVRMPLLRQLSEASMRCRVSLLRGAAGSGKTTLLAHWRTLLVDMGKPVVWLSLDVADRDMSTFIGDFVAAYSPAAEASFEPSLEFSDLLSGHGHAETVARQLATDLNKMAQRLIVILDGFEAIDGSDTAQVIHNLIQHTHTVHWVIASRVRPRLSLAALRARDELFELSPNDLNLTAGETVAFLGQYVPDLYARCLFAKTDGSPVALQFAHRVLERDEPTLMNDSWQDWLHDYYREQILDWLPADLSHAMSRLVVVECFDLSLAEALVGPAAADIVDKLSHTKGLLLRDKHSRAFHFPEVLRSFLESRLEWIPQEERRQLHMRACDWFAQRGMYEEALGHAAKCGAYEQAASFLGQVDHYRLLLRSGTLSIGQLLESLCSEAPQQLTSQLSLTILRAHEGKIHEARQMAGQLKLVQKSLAVDDDMARTLEHGLALLEGISAGYLGEPMDFSQVDILQRFLASKIEGSHYARALSCVFLAWNHYQLGQLNHAEKLLNDADIEYAGSEGILGNLFLHVHRALLQFWNNKLDVALSETVLAEKMAHLFFPENQRLHVLTAIFKHGFLLGYGHRDARISPLDLVGAASRLEAWFDALLWGHQFAIRAALIDGGFDEARALCHNGREVGHRMGCERLVWHMRRDEIMVTLIEGNVEKAWRLACELGLPQQNFMAETTTQFGWQEQFSGLALLIQLYQAKKEYRHAHQILKMFAAELEKTPVPRFEAIYGILTASLAEQERKPNTAASALAQTRAMFPNDIPVQLLQEYGRNLRDQMDHSCGKAVGPFINPPQIVKSVTTATDDPLLTSREKEIMNYMRDGHSSKITAHYIGLSEATVKFHLRNIYRKLNAKNRTQALSRYRDVFGII